MILLMIKLLTSSILLNVDTKKNTVSDNQPGGTFLESDHLSIYPLSLQLLKTLLVVGNVESNPGPMTNERLFTELILGSDDDYVKKVLGKLKTDKCENANYTNLKAMKVDVLKSVLTYLMNWNETD